MLLLQTDVAGIINTRYIRQMADKNNKGRKPKHTIYICGRGIHGITGHIGDTRRIKFSPAQLKTVTIRRSREMI